MILGTDRIPDYLILSVYVTTYIAMVNDMNTKLSNVKSIDFKGSCTIKMPDMHNDFTIYLFFYRCVS